MIIFDLDGTLADFEHRRYFVNPAYHPDFHINGSFAIDYFGRCCNQVGEPFKPDWKSFYEACDKDMPINPTILLLRTLWIKEGEEIEIWSARCESVRDKTISWLTKYVFVKSELCPLKMRPIGDNTPDDHLKERWLNERCSDLMTAKIEGINPSRHDVDFVFDSDPKSIAMYRRRGIFVFNCCQHEGEF